MNRIDRRIAGTDAGMPGSGVCLPGDNGKSRGMLGRGSLLYSRKNRMGITRQTQSINQKRNIEQFKKKVNNNQTNNKTITRLESKLEHIEKSNALNIVGIHQKINVQETEIKLIKGDFKKQITILKNYIKELENKIEKMNNREVLVAKKVENIDNIEKNDTTEQVEIEVIKEINNIKKAPFNRNNVTLEIVES